MDSDFDIDIDSDTEHQLENLVHSRPEMLEVVREAITNAHRHGAASAISIELENAPEGVELIISDNGYGPRGGEPGLGSALLDGLAGASWRLETGVPTGATLRVSLGVAPAE